MKTIAISLAASTVLAVPACGTTRPAPPAAPPQSAAAPASTPSAPAAPLALKATRSLDFPTWSARVTVYAYRQPLHSEFPPRRRGTTYAGADVKYCNVRADNIEAGVSWAPWSLSFKDDTGIDAVDEWSPEWFSVPLYPATGRTIAVGRCVRGWILFAVPKTKRPVRLTYAPSGEDGDQVPPTDWAVR